MAGEDVMGQVMGTTFQWATATEAMASLAALLTVGQADAEVPEEIVDALRDVASAAGLGGLDDLAPPQAAAVAGVIRMSLHMALDLLDHPDRAPGWTFTDPAILDGIGRGSSMVPMAIAAAHPDLANVSSFLDVGTGVGFLAIAAANVWPSATVVGIDPWAASLERARANVAHAGLDHRITLRPDELGSIEDTDAFECVWVPTFFLNEPTLVEALPAVLRALRPGGWVVLGVHRPSPDPLANATDALRWIRSGGTQHEPEEAAKLLANAGFAGAHVAPPGGPLPMAFVLGQRDPGSG